MFLFIKIQTIKKGDNKNGNNKKYYLCRHE